MIPCDTHILSIACHFLFALGLDGPINMCILVISCLSHSFEVNELIFLIRMYLFMPPIKIIWSPLFLQIFMSSARSDRKSVLGYYLLLRLEK